MKKNILVPMAGLGKRFADQNYILPKQLLAIKGKHLLDISLESLIFENEDQLIFIIRKETNLEFNIGEIIKNKYDSNKVIIIEIEEQTRGSVESCLKAKDIINNETPLIIHTLDVQFFPKIQTSHLIHQGDGHILTFKSNSENYSYVQKDLSGKVIKTAEKQVVSNDACVGVYVFNRGSDFVKYGEEMINKEITTRGEFFITPLYNLLINDSKTINTTKVDKIHIFGTPEEYEFYKNNVAIKFGDKPIGLCSDHSGYKLKELVKKELSRREIDFIDFGTYSDEDCDYQPFVEVAAKSMMNNEIDHSLGFCRTGQGVNIVANKNTNIRSALAYSKYSLEMSIRHNCANFFSIPNSLVEDELTIKEIVEILLNTTFDGGRHQVRIQSIE